MKRFFGTKSLSTQAQPFHIIMEKNNKHNIPLWKRMENHGVTEIPRKNVKEFDKNPILDVVHANVPEPGVYTLYDPNDTLCWIGETGYISRRCRNHVWQKSPSNLNVKIVENPESYACKDIKSYKVRYVIIRDRELRRKVEKFLLLLFCRKQS